MIISQLFLRPHFCRYVGEITGFKLHPITILRPQHIVEKPWETASGIGTIIYWVATGLPAAFQPGNPSRK